MDNLVLFQLEADFHFVCFIAVRRLEKSKMCRITSSKVSKPKDVQFTSIEMREKQHIFTPEELGWSPFDTVEPLISYRRLDQLID